MFLVVFLLCVFFFFKQKTAYELRISDWSSDVCSSDLSGISYPAYCVGPPVKPRVHRRDGLTARGCPQHPAAAAIWSRWSGRGLVDRGSMHGAGLLAISRSEEHTSELQSLMRISYAVFCLNKKNKINQVTSTEYNKLDIY